MIKEDGFGVVEDGGALVVGVGRAGHAERANDMRRYRVALSGDASKGNWAYLSDYDQNNEDQNIIYWGDTGVAGTVAMIVLDTSLDMLYFGTWSTRTRRL